MTTDAPLVVRDETIPEDELGDAIRQLTPGQQAVIVALAANPTLAKPQLADKAGVGRTTLHKWFKGSGDAFRAIYNTIQLISIDALPSLTVSLAKRHALEAIHRDVELAVSDNSESTSRLNSQLRVRETLYKVAGVLKEQGTPVITIDKMLVQIAGANEYPLGGIKGKVE